MERFHSRGERLCKFIGTIERQILHKKRVELPQDWFGQGPPHVSAVELGIPWNCNGIVFGLNGTYFTLLVIGK